MNENGVKKLHWTEYFRVITPFLLLIITYIGGDIGNKLKDIDNKMFVHLTNDEIHSPRTQTVSKSEYEMVQKMRDNQWATICKDIAELKVSINSIRR